MVNTKYGSMTQPVSVADRTTACEAVRPGSTPGRATQSLCYRPALGRRQATVLGWWFDSWQGHSMNVPKTEGGNIVDNHDDNLNDGARVVGGAGALIAAILGGLARHADDVGRSVPRHADDFGRVGVHQVDDFSRPAFQTADDLFRHLDVDDSGRLRITQTDDDFSRTITIDNHVDDVVMESDAFSAVFARRTAHEAMLRASRLALEPEDRRNQ